jgi:molybdate transport repressor ModE-like protein
MRLEPSIAWRLAGTASGTEPLDVRVIPLLRAVARHASLRGAAAHCALSYRAAWGLLRECEARFGTPLARLERGRGAALAPAGEALLRADDAAAQRLASGRGLALEIAPERAPRATQPLRVAASHDIALAQLRDALPATGPLRLDLAFTGSTEALTAYARGDADVGGFHLVATADVSGAHAFRGLLDARRDRLIAFAVREQGLILPPGNPRRVRSLGDVASRKLRFLNRQPGSGTRVLVDALLARAGVARTDVRGYDSAERNHIAMAGAVASGAADVGFGLRAAAAEFGLAFVLLARERYLFAVRASKLPGAEIQAFLALLRGALAARALARLPGYQGRDAGRVMNVSEVFGR